MRFNLTAMARRQGLRRSTTIRDIRPPEMYTLDLFRAAYLPVVSVWEEVVGPLSAEYRRSLNELTTDAPSDLDTILNEAERRTGAIFFSLKPALERWTLFVERWYRGKWNAAVLSASKVDLSTMLGPADVRVSLETSIANNVALVRSVSDEARQKMSQAVYDGLRNRTPADEVARRLKDVAGMGRARARRCASDQLRKLTSSLAEERRRQAGLMLWRWKHSGKLHPREDHKARNDVIYSDDPADVGRKVMGQTVRAAPPPGDRVGQKPFCGCVALSVLEI